VKRFFLSAIDFYQRRISPGLPAGCRYLPTCSHYGREAIAKHGVVHGTVLIIWRLMRCNPLSKGGYDPVP
jgi:putative membrane protein insertion efficiency factor